MATERPIHPIAVGDVLAGRYRLDAVLGEGGMGTVYAGRDLELDRAVAVKVLLPSWVNDDDVVARFEKEARLTARLEHPNIVAIYDVGQVNARPFFVMQRLSGQTLASALRHKGALPLRETVALMRQLASGIDFIHAQRFIHRDIKSENVFLSDDGHATLLDFGILRHSDASATRSGLYLGTPHYMSPEQALGAATVDHRADLYALAVVMYECLSGTLPFEADSELRLVHLQAHAPAPEILDRAPWLSKATAQVVRRALLKKPEDRFPTAAALVEALAATNDEGQGLQAAPSAPRPRTGAHSHTQVSSRRSGAAGPWRPFAKATFMALVFTGLGIAFQPLRAQTATPQEAPAIIASRPLPPLPAVEPTEPPAPEPAPKAPLAKPALSRLTVVALHQGEPFWGQVSIDGVTQGRTPLFLELSPGVHRVRVERSGFASREFTVNLLPGTSAAERVELERLP